MNGVEETSIPHNFAFNIKSNNTDDSYSFPSFKTLYCYQSVLTNPKLRWFKFWFEILKILNEVLLILLLDEKCTLICNRFYTWKTLDLIRAADAVNISIILWKRVIKTLFIYAVPSPIRSFASSTCISAKTLHLMYLLGSRCDGKKN